MRLLDCWQPSRDRCENRYEGRSDGSLARLASGRPRRWCPRETRSRPATVSECALRSLERAHRPPAPRSRSSVVTATLVCHRPTRRVRLNSACETSIPSKGSLWQSNAHVQLQRIQIRVRERAAHINSDPCQLQRSLGWPRLDLSRRGCGSAFGQKRCSGADSRGYGTPERHEVSTAGENATVRGDRKCDSHGEPALTVVQFLPSFALHTPPGFELGAGEDRCGSGAMEPPC